MSLPDSGCHQQYFPCPQPSTHPPLLHLQGQHLKVKGSQWSTDTSSNSGIWDSHLKNGNWTFAEFALLFITMLEKHIINKCIYIYIIYIYTPFCLWSEVKYWCTIRFTPHNLCGSFPSSRLNQGRFCWKISTGINALQTFWSSYPSRYKYLAFGYL